MDTQIVGDSKRGGGVLDDGGIHPAVLEHGCTLHLYTITVRPMYGFVKGTMGASRDAVLGTGGT